MNLNDMNPGEVARVSRLRTSGPMRRRLLDIGLVENTKIQCIRRSQGGNLTAFLIRGSVIAIRAEDCCDVLIEQNAQGSIEPTEKCLQEGEPAWG